MAILTPLHKSGDKYDADNYNPISVLPVLSKITEKAVNLQRNKCLEKKVLYYQATDLATEKRSTELATTLLLDQIRKEANNDNCCRPVIKKQHCTCGYRMPKQRFNVMACDSKLHPIILWRVISVKLNIDKKTTWLGI